MDKEKPTGAVLPVSDAMREPLRSGVMVALSDEERAERIAKGLHVEWAEGVGYHYFPRYDVDEEIAAILADTSPVTEEDKPLIEAFDRATATAKARLAALSVQEPTPSPAVVVDESSLLAAMAKNICLELSWGEVSDFEGESCQWRVHERNGNHNDREWRLKGVGETPLAALKAALAEASQNAGGEQPAPKAEQQLAEIEEMLGGQGDDDGPQILPNFEEGMSTVAKVEACLFRLEKWRDLIEVYDRRPAPNGVSGAVREALEVLKTIRSMRNLQKLAPPVYGFEHAKHNEAWAKIDEQIDAALSQGSSPSAREES